MSTLARTALVLSSCVACLALWQLRDLAPEPRSGAVRDGLAAVEPGVRSDGDPERVHAPLERDLVRDPAVQGTPLEDPAAGPPIPIRAHLVDALTGESVPDLGLVLSDGQRTLEVRSDAEGRVLHGESLAQGTIELRERDHDGPGAATTAPRRVSFPLPERLPVHVGPTFRLRLDLPDGVSIDELTAHFHEPVQRRQVGRPTSVRRGDLPWVRFPFEVTTLAGNGPFVLEVTHRSGLWRATAEVSRKQGVERVPVFLDLQPTGVAQFRVEQPEGTPKTIFLLDVESESGGVRRRLYPSDADSGPGFAGGRLSHLEPGAYRWILGGAGGRSGTFHVEAGRTTRVEISPDATGLTFDTAVRIDASADPGLDPKAVMAFVVHAERMDSGFQTRARHEEGDPPGIWWVRLQEVPAGRWLVAFTSPSEAAVWDPPFVLVSPSIVPPTVTLVSLGEMVPVRLTVVDASGLPIPGAEATSTSDGLTETWFTPDGTGGLLPGNLPSQRTSTLHVRAPGHRCRAVEHHPERDGRELAVRLEPGWSNRVRVLDAATLRGAEGVRVLADGVPVGETDGRGEVWLTGQAPPAELQVTGEGVEVVTAPADRSDEGADPLAGWIFVVSLR